MKNERKNPVIDSGNYTFVSVETLRNVFPIRASAEGVGRVRATKSNFVLTREGFAGVLKHVSRKIS